MSFHSTPPANCSSLEIQARPHQLVALGKVEHNTQTPLKDTMVADPMGLGKTLVAIMAVANAVRSAKRFSIIVATSSCLKQWEAEFGKFLKKVCCLRNPCIHWLELTRGK